MENTSKDLLWNCITAQTTHSLRYRLQTALYELHCTNYYRFKSVSVNTRRLPEISAHACLQIPVCPGTARHAILVILCREIMKCKLCCAYFNSNIYLHGLLKAASEIGLNCIFLRFSRQKSAWVQILMFSWTRLSKIFCLRRIQTGNIYIFGTFQAEFSVSQSDWKAVFKWLQDWKI